MAVCQNCGRQLESLDMSDPPAGRDVADHGPQGLAFCKREECVEESVRVQLKEDKITHTRGLVEDVPEEEIVPPERIGEITNKVRRELGLEEIPEKHFWSGREDKEDM